MKYLNEEIEIQELITYIEKDQINLKPPYQRNFIWAKKDQSNLIDSILKGYPLPTFFIYRKPNKSLEMVDGQQRSRTIYRFFKGLISSGNRENFDEIDKDSFLLYKLNWTIIYDLNKEDSLESFYTLVNKTGKHLNVPELYKAEYHQTNLLKLVEELLDLQELINLDLFTDATKKRMNDRSFVEELVSLMEYGITDKKNQVEKLYKKDVDLSEYHKLKKDFIKSINKIGLLNQKHPINKTRYKQRNDFYTLFSFVKNNLDEDDELLCYQYEILRYIEQYIRPSNDDCRPLKEYAINCVSQSNSKNAREKRLDFFNAVLKNEEPDGNIEVKEILDFLEVEENRPFSLKRINKFYLVDVQN